jgi:hypothetical protein
LITLRPLHYRMIIGKNWLGNNWGFIRVENKEEAGGI